MSSSDLVMPIQATIEALGTNGGASFHGASSLFPEMPSFDHEDSVEKGGRLILAAYALRLGVLLLEGQRLVEGEVLEGVRLLEG